MSNKKVDILAIGVHPDDIELGCGGTLLSHIQQGKKVGILDLTRGELGTRGSAEIRDKEAADSARLMGAIFRENLAMADGFFQYSKENLLKIISVIRSSQPVIVLANSLEDRHPDHGRASKLIADACYYAGLSKIETFDKNGVVQEKWRPKAVYHYIQDYNLTPDFVVDITGFMDKKIELVQAFSSQFFAPATNKYAKEANSPISGQDFIDFLYAKAKTYGRHAGFEHAEGFNKSRDIGVKSLFDLV